MQTNQWYTILQIQAVRYLQIASAMAYDFEVQRKLVKGNWIRTAAWSARGLLVLWMVGQVISNVATNPTASELAQNDRP